MARTNIEDSAFTRALELAYALDWEPVKALGALTWFWHESQAKLKVTGTGHEIYRWSKLPSTGSPEVYIEALLELELIERVDGGDGPFTLQMEFRIKGNEDEIQNLVNLKQKSKKGGDATRAKWEKERQKLNRPDGRPDGHATERPAGLPQLGTVQCSAVQSNSDQSNATPPNPQKAAAPETPPAESQKRCVEIWLKTLGHFKQPRPLIRNEDMEIARAIQRYGADAVELALIGIRHEKKSDAPGGFDPAQHVHLRRVLDPEKFARFVGLGAAEAEKRREKIESLKPAHRVREMQAGGIEDSAPLSREQIRLAIKAQFPEARFAREQALPGQAPKEPETTEEIRAVIDEQLARATAEGVA